jgi:hypothetical protein
MCKLPELELEFEIVTLSHNIEKLKKLGLRTADLQSRLAYCQSQFRAINSVAEFLDNSASECRSTNARTA